MKYEIDCLDCDGTGGNIKHKMYYKCDYCDGSGTVLTNDGKELLDFLEKYLKLQVKGQ